MATRTTENPARATEPSDAPAAAHASTLRTRYAAHLTALRAAQKPARGTAAYSRFVNRPAARRTAAAGALVGLTPNGATVLSALLSGTGLALVALGRPTWLLGVTVAVLLALGYVLDSVDGQLARLRGGGSLAGEWLDHTVDCVKTCTLHLVVLVSLYRFPGTGWPDTVLVLPLVFLVIDVTCYFGIISMPFLRARSGSPSTGGGGQERRARRDLFRAWVILPTDYGVFCWLFVLLGHRSSFVIGYGAMLLVYGALLVLALRKWWLELRTLDAVRGTGG